MVDTNVKVYVVCGAVLYLKFFLAAQVHGRKKYKIGGHPPEDVKLGFAAAQAQGRKQNFGVSSANDESLVEAREEEQRWMRIVANDLESIPFAMFVFGGGVLAGSNSVVHASAMVVYTVARCVHTIVYAKALQPHRIICFVAGTTATFVGVLNALVAIS